MSLTKYLSNWSLKQDRTNHHNKGKLHLNKNGWNVLSRTFVNEISMIFNWQVIDNSSNINIKGCSASVSVCMYICVFPSTVKASPDWNKTINVMPEIRPAMLCWGNYSVSRTFAATS